MNYPKSILLLSFSFYCGLSFSQSNEIEKKYPSGKTQVKGNVITAEMFEGAEVYNAPSGTDVQTSDQPTPLLKDGAWTYYYENGTIAQKASYNKGKKVGLSTKYDEKGNVTEVIDYNTGKAVFYHSNGKKSQEGILDANDRKNGFWTGWYSNGELMYEGTFTHGKEVEVKHFSRK